MKGLSKVPAHVRKKAEAIAERIDEGTTVHDLGGRRLSHDRMIVSIPIGRRWRLIVRDHGDRLEAHAVMSHEQYSRGAKPR